MAITGIIVPVIVHLWNNKPGKVLAIGSVVLLEKSTQRQSRSRRVSEWLLLLLRCLLLLFLALLLCGPFWKQAPQDKGVKGWVLVDKAAWKKRDLIDSLLRSGYVLHEWDDPTTSYWTLFEQADRQAPAGIPLYVFSSGRLDRFTGRRPITSRAVRWYTYPSPDSVRAWIEAAWLLTPDSIRIATRVSRSTGDAYSYRQLPVREAKKGADGRSYVAMDSQPPVVVDTGAIPMTIVADGAYGQDSRYLAAAIRAWQTFTGRNIRLRIIGIDQVAGMRAGSGSTAGGMQPSRQDWLFWLSVQPLSSRLADSTANILVYEQGSSIPVQSWVKTNTGSGSGGQPAAIELTKMIPAASEGYSPVWEDGFGRPLLALEKRSGIGNVFHFYSHFDPGWNGLVWSPSFPILLQDLFFTRTAPARDLREIDPAQAAPQTGKGDAIDMGGRSGGDRIAIDLAPACWIIIFLLLLTERLVALRSPKTEKKLAYD